MNDVTVPELVASTLHRGVQAAVPLALAANGELIAERAGLLNIGIEGVMLIGALGGVASAWWTGSAVAGLIGAALAGALAALLFALWTVAWRRDQAVTGLAINLLAFGLTGVAVQRLDRFAESHGSTFVAPPLPMPAGIDPLATLTLLVVAVTHVAIFCTRPGLTLRAVGENPEAADTAGIRVALVRFIAAAVGGALVGLAGGALSVGMTHRFQEFMTGGRGFLALALVIFGRWSPIGVAIAACFFGLLDALQVTLQPALGDAVHLLYPALVALPYVLTLVALAGVTGRARAPAALATPYDPR